MELDDALIENRIKNDELDINVELTALASSIDGEDLEEGEGVGLVLGVLEDDDLYKVVLKGEKINEKQAEELEIATDI